MMQRFERTQTFAHDVGVDGALTVRTTGADVTVHAVDGTEARVEALYHVRAADDDAADRILAAGPVSVRSGEGSLDVEVREMRGGLLPGLGIAVGQRSVGVDLRIAAPPGTTLRIQGVNSDIHVRGIHGRQELKTISGDIIVREAQGELAVNSVSGEIVVTATGPVTLDGSTTSGDVAVTCPLFRSSRVQSVSGDVELVGSFSPDGEHRVGTVSGDLRLAPGGGVTVEASGLSTTVRSELEHRTTSDGGKRVTIVGDGAARVVFRSMSGNVRITRPSDTRSTVPPVAAGMDASEPDVAPDDETTEWEPGSAVADRTPDEELTILRALERGEIDVDEASRLLTGVSSDG